MLRRRWIVLITLLAFLVSSNPALAIDGVWHKPYGIDDLYIIEATERSPRDPMAGETIYVKLTTWPVEPGQAAWLTWKKNGVSQPDIGAAWKYNSGNNSYWEAAMGPFAKGDVIEYTVHANKDGTNEKINGPHTFTVTDWDRVKDVTGYTNPGGRVEFTATSVSGQQNPKIAFSFTADDTFRVQMAPNPASVTFASGLNNYTVSDQGSYYLVTTPALRLEVQKSPYRLSVKKPDGTLISQGYDPNLYRNMSWRSNGSGVIDQVADYFASPSTEKFIGFGERFNTVLKRGENVDIYAYDKYRDQQEKSYLPIPFFISTAGYGLYVNSTYYTNFRLATDAADRYGWTTGTAGDGAGMLDYYFMAGDPKRVLDRYTSITGRPVVPPKWSFGPLMSANEWNTDAEVRDQVAKTNQYNIPHTGLVLEQWSDEMTFYIWGGAQFTPKPGSWAPTLADFTFGTQFPDPKGMVDYLHQNGIKVLLWQAPINKYPQAEDYSLRDPNAIQQNRNDEDYMIVQGYAVGNGSGGQYRIPSGLWFPNSLVPDFTNTTAKDWWMSKRAYLFDEIGIDGIKTDGGENIWERPTTFSTGQKKPEMRNRFPLTYIGAFNDFVQSKTAGNGITFARSGAAGVQRYPIHWAGDQESTFPAFQSQVKAAISAGASGIPFSGWDLAGFSGALPTPELYKRSLMAAAFSPVMQFHSEGANPTPSLSRSPWNMEAQTLDSTVRTTYERFANIRMNLLPYTYSEAIKAGNTGVPLMRAMLIDYPNDSTTWDLWSQYMFGDNLLVAPIVDQGSTSKSLYLPAGEWIDLFWGAQRQGAKWLTYGADTNSLPVFVKAGAVLPMNLNSSYALGGTIGNSVTAYTNLTFAIYPYGTSTYDFYEDRGSAAKTFTVTEEYAKHRVSVDWPALTVPSTLRIYTTRPSAVTVGSAVSEVASLSALNAASSGWYYDAQNQFLYVKQPSSTVARTLVVDGTDKAAFEAEYGTLNAVSTNTDHPGYTGSSFVDGFETAGDWVERDVTVRETGTYKVGIRYSAGSGAASRAVYVDGGKKLTDISLPATANWDTWNTAYVLASLTPGEHKIKVSYESQNFTPINLDNISLTRIEAPMRQFYQEAAMIGNNYVAGMLDERGSVYDFMYPLGIYKGIVVDGADANGTSGVQVDVNQAVAGIEIGGEVNWANDPALWNYTQQYVTDSATVQTVATHKTQPLTLTHNDFSPRGITFPNTTGGQPIRGMHIKRLLVQNTGSSALDVGLLYYADLNLNGEGYNDAVSYVSADDALYTTDPGGYGGRTRTVSYAVKAKVSGAGTTGSSYQVYPDGAGYLKKTVTIPAGGTVELQVLTVGATSATTGADLYATDLKPALDWWNTADAGALQTTTDNNWKTLVDGASSIETPDPRYNQHLRRSLITSVLHFDLNTGAMAAGFHNGAYAYNWPRDTVYGAVTLDRAGIHDIPNQAFNWLWNTAERDTSTNDIGNDGIYYRYWYQKYTMDGKREWEQPQVDETAVIPWGVLFHYKQTGDSTFLNSYYPMAREAAWVSSENNPHPGLDYNENTHLMFSMSIWEDMWGMFLYSNANVVAGLRAAKTLADLTGDTANSSLFQSRADDILNNGILPAISSTDTVNPGMYDQDRNRFFFTKDLKKWYTDPTSIWNAITTDVSMLGITVPFDVLPANDSRVVNTVAELEPALTDGAETGVATGGVVRYRQDQVSRYGSTYANFGDTYFDGGPWMMATSWLSMYKLKLAGYRTGKAEIDAAKSYLDYVLDYTGNLGIGSEQIDETKTRTQFAKQAAWGNVWESNGTIVDNLYSFLDFDYDAPSSTLKVAPKIPTAWSYLGGNLVLKDGRFYIKQTKVSSTQDQVILTNNTASSVTVDVFIQTDADPTSVSGQGSLTWTYDAASGRVRLQGAMAAGAGLTITINH